MEVDLLRRAEQVLAAVEFGVCGLRSEITAHLATKHGTRRDAPANTALRGGAGAKAGAAGLVRSIIPSSFARSAKQQQ